MTGPDEIVQAARSNGVRASLFSGLDSVRTVVEASDAADRPLGQVGNTVLVTVKGRPVLVLVPGDRRIQGEQIGRAYDAEPLEVSLGSKQEVHDHTGFDVGMIPPIGLDETMDLLVDAPLLDHDTVLVPSGSPDALIEIATNDLANLKNAKVGSWSVPVDEES